MQNVIALLKEQLSDALLEKIAAFLGETKSGVTSAVGGALPAILLGFMKKGTEPGGADRLMTMLQQGEHDGGSLADLGRVVGGGSASTDLLASGTKILGSVLGDRAGGIGDLIASNSGISKQAGSSLLSMLAPVVMSALGKQLKSQGSVNAQGLMALLLGQKDYIKAALPAGVSGLLGVTNLDDLGRQARQAPPVPASNNWKWILAVLAACLLLFFWWRGCNTPPVGQEVRGTAQETATAVQGAAGEVKDTASGLWASLGNFFSKKLPNGVELNIPELGIENKLIAFIDDAARPVDDTTWFSFDRLLFDTNQATLKSESEEQLKNVAEILKAYPKVTLKIGGYTDSTGDPQANLTLSQQRAETVMAGLVAQGIDASRLKAEGYGQEHPVADNATEAGRAQNRRIDIRVTAK